MIKLALVGFLSAMASIAMADDANPTPDKIEEIHEDWSEWVLGTAMEVIALANEGCQHIQIDEPLFARNPADALDFGFENLERAFYKVPRTVSRTAHMCCGYPDRLDSIEYPVAVRDASLTIQGGEFFSFLGPSGCGKTTLLRAISGFQHPSTCV